MAFTFFTNKHFISHVSSISRSNGQTIKTLNFSIEDSSSASSSSSPSHSPTAPTKFYSNYISRVDSDDNLYFDSNTDLKTLVDTPVLYKTRKSILQLSPSQVNNLFIGNILALSGTCSTQTSYHVAKEINKTIHAIYKKDKKKHETYDVIQVQLRDLSAPFDKIINDFYTLALDDKMKIIFKTFSIEPVRFGYNNIRGPKTIELTNLLTELFQMRMKIDVEIRKLMER